MSSCIFPGSFDPITKGHVDLIARSLRMFDKVTVALLNNITKKAMFTLDERLSLIKDCFPNEPRITIIGYDGMLSELAEQTGCSIIVRGLRSSADLRYELDMAEVNRLLNPGLETVLLPAAPEYRCISSSYVREILSFDREIDGFVDVSIAQKVYALYHEHRQDNR